jgi:hypothetical protein
MFAGVRGVCVYVYGARIYLGINFATDIFWDKGKGGGNFFKNKFWFF